MDAEAQAFLMRDSLELIQLRHLDYSTAAQIWTRLHTIYVEKSDQLIQIFFDELRKCKNELEKIADHISLVQRHEHGTKKSYYHCKNLIKFKNKI